VEKRVFRKYRATKISLKNREEKKKEQTKRGIGARRRGYLGDRKRGAKLANRGKKGRMGVNSKWVKVPGYRTGETRISNWYEERGQGGGGTDEKGQKKPSEGEEKKKTIPNLALPFFGL